MNFKDLPAFLEYLEKNNHLKRIKEVVSTQLEVTEISKRFLHNNGPALLFENVIKEDGKKSKFPIVTNLYAHPQRISWALGLNSQSELRQFGKLLAFLKNPEPPSSIKETFSMLPIAKRILSMSPKNVKKAVCQEVVILEPDLNILPIQKCWPLDVSPLVIISAYIGCK